MNAWQLGSRPIWMELALTEHDLSTVTESTDMQLNIIGRLPKEPPSGRYSHLLGRYMPAETFRVQAAYETALKLRPGKDYGADVLKDL